MKINVSLMNINISFWWRMFRRGDKSAAEVVADQAKRDLNRNAKYKRTKAKVNRTARDLERGRENLEAVKALYRDRK